MWIKICGVTTEDDALMAVALGADAVGFVFAPSKRQVTVGTVRDIVRRLPPEVMTIGVFRDQSPKFMVDTVLEAGLAGAQLHGHETPAMAQEVRPKVKVLIAAFAAGGPGLDRFDEYGADAVLLDGETPGAGAIFDWSKAEGVGASSRLILAGGLNPTNVGQAIQTVKPWGVDVSTGVESGPGRKDPKLVREFIHAARDAAALVTTGSESSHAQNVSDGPFDAEGLGEL